jgi:hypothetical protein
MNVPYYGFMTMHKAKDWCIFNFFFVWMGIMLAMEATCVILVIKCCNLSLKLATKARACKGAGKKEA